MNQNDNGMYADFNGTGPYIGLKHLENRTSLAR